MITHDPLFDGKSFYELDMRGPNQTYIMFDRYFSLKNVIMDIEDVIDIKKLKNVIHA